MCKPMHGHNQNHQDCNLTKNSNVGKTWCELAKSVGKFFSNNTAGHTADVTGRQARRSLDS